ncbi:MAG TPA: FimV/HubP family polar landmark protein [Gammaproteobacteria bacterium]|nr:FimV/HubP family polar landmark protein [Gammaproteobacteria bacterium]
MYKKPACVLALLSLVLPATVWALGLGSIRTQSALNQPFKAEIPLVAASGQDLSGIQAGLASRQAYQQAGLDYSGELDELRFSVVKTAHGPAIRITSDKPIKEPLLNLLVDVQWSQGQLEREYDVLLDPPTMMARESHPSPQSATVSPSSGQPGGQAGATAQHAPRHPQRHLPGTYRVGRNDTLWGIARKLRPDHSVTVNQMMVALYQRNPHAFRGNMNRLKRGAVLRVPSMPDVAAVGRLDAYREARRQHRAWVAARGHAQQHRVASASGHRARLELVAPGSSHKGGKSSGQAAQGGASASGGGSSAGSGGKQLATLQNQVQQLQQQVGKLQHMMNVRNNQLAQLQAELKKQQAGATGAAAAGTSGAASQHASASQTGPGGPSAGASASGGGPQKPANGGPGAARQAAGTTSGSQAGGTASAPQKIAENNPAPAAGTASSGGGPASTGKAANAGKPAGSAKASGSGSPPAGGQGQHAGKPATKHAAVAPKKAAGTAHPAPAPKPSIMDRVMAVVAVIGQVLRNPLALAAVVGLPLLLGLLVAVRRRRQAAEAGGVLESEDIGGLDLDEDPFGTGAAGDTDSLAITGDTGPVTEGSDDGTMQVEAGSTAPYVAGDEIAPGAERDYGSSAEPEEDVAVEVEDPVSEVDFHLAYGLYDEALGIVDKAIENEPSRRDLKLKKLEVLFAAGRAEAFLEDARKLAEEPQGTSDSNWDKAAIMGRQLFPEEPLFSADGGGPGDIEDDFLDIDLPAEEAAGGEPAEASPEPEKGRDAGEEDGEDETGISLDDLMPDEEDVSPDATTASMADRGRGDRPEGVRTTGAESPGAGQPREGAPQGAGDDALEFDLDDLQPAAAGGGEQRPADESAQTADDADGLDFDLDALTAGADEGDEFRWSEEQAGGTDGGAAGDEDALEFDLSEEWAGATAGESEPAARESQSPETEDATEAAGEAESDSGQDPDLDEFDIDLGEESTSGEPAARGQQAQDSAGPAAPAGDGEAGGEIDEDEVATKLDLAEAYLGMEDTEGARALLEEVLAEGTGEQRERARQMLAQADGAGTGAAAGEETSAGESVGAPASARDGGRDEPVGYGDDVGTKLDLARAYIGMEDTEAARRMLDEVLQEGDEAQKQEARSLLDELG